MNKIVYLAGPIAGLSYHDATNTWRSSFRSMLLPAIQCASPMRGKDFLSHVQEISNQANEYANNVMSSAKGITTRDHNDVYTCDVMVANFLGAERCSAGTCIEFGWAHAYKKPVIMVIEENGVMANEKQNPHFHPMLTSIAGYVVPTLEEAALLVNWLLGPSVSTDLYRG